MERPDRERVYGAHLHSGPGVGGLQLDATAAREIAEPSFDPRRFDTCYQLRFHRSIALGVATDGEFVLSQTRRNHRGRIHPGN